MTCDRFVELDGGLIVPAEALSLLLNLERRGVVVRPDGDGGVVVVGLPVLQPEEQFALLRWRHHVGAILATGGRERA